MGKRLPEWDAPPLEGTIQNALLDLLEESRGLVTGDPGNFLNQLQEEFARRGIHLGTLQLYSALTRLRSKPPGDKENGIWLVKSGPMCRLVSGFCQRKREVDFSEARYLGDYKVW